MQIEAKDLKKFKTIFVFERYNGTDGWKEYFDNSEEAINYAINEWDHFTKYEKKEILNRDDVAVFKVTENNIILEEDGEYYPENEEIDVFWDVFSYEKIGDLEEKIKDKLNKIENLTESIHDEFISSKLRDCDQEDISTIKDYINQLNKLKEGIEENQHTIKNLKKDLISEEREAKKINIKTDQEVKRYEEKGFDYWQLFEIRKGLENGVDIDKYADLKFSRNQMEQIRLGLEEGIDVNKYADPKFNFYEMLEIRCRLVKTTDRKSVV